jgi:hypothetical protein
MSDESKVSRPAQQDEDVEAHAKVARPGAADEARIGRPGEMDEGDEVEAHGKLDGRMDGKADGRMD